MTSEQLIKQITAIARDEKRPFEQRLMDTAVWWEANKDRIPRENIPKRLDFMEIMCSILLEMMAMSLERHYEQGRTGGSSLWLPTGMSMRGDVKQFG